MSIFGQTPFGLRFPSMMEFYSGSVAILPYFRRKAGIAFAAFAVLLMWAAVLTLYYAVEARPYVNRQSHRSASKIVPKSFASGTPSVLPFFLSPSKNHAFVRWPTGNFLERCHHSDRVRSCSL
jgi:hypothetical protein